VKIPLYRIYWDEEDINAVSQVIRRASWWTKGVEINEFEEKIAKTVNRRHAVALNSGTSALYASMLALGIGAGDEVIVPSSTFISTALAPQFVDAKPVFADIDTTLNIAAWHLIQQDIKAIIPVHFMGQPADMKSIMAYAHLFGWKVIEDACQAIGATYDGKYVGTFGDCGIFSFNQSKPISCGEGGMLITNDEEIATISRLVRNHGETQSNILGYNYRMCEIEAVIALEQFKELDKMNDHRIKLANILTEGLNKIDGLTPPQVPPNTKHVYYTYPVWVDHNRDELQEKLLERGIYFGKGGWKPLHLYPIYGGHEGQFPVAERMWREVMFTDRLRYPATEDDVYAIIREVKKII